MTRFFFVITDRDYFLADISPDINPGFLVDDDDRSYFLADIDQGYLLQMSTNIFSEDVGRCYFLDDVDQGFSLPTLVKVIFLPLTSRVVLANVN